MENFLEGADILVTGATGFIGKNLIRYIHSIAPSCHVIAVVHSIDKARKIFSDEKWLTVLETDLNNPFFFDGNVDYIIHGASITSSKQFIEQPVDTILTSINGTKSMLELACQKKVKSFVFLSSMEVYGAPNRDDKIAEDAGCSMDSMQKRSSYPESKRLCETMCNAYHAQYGVPVKVVRLTQTIGAGVDYDDGRVFAEFARCVVEKRDIMLRTKGLTKRCYISMNDAVKAIITVLLDGIDGEAYNAANEETYCSIYDMAYMVAKKVAEGHINVCIQANENIEHFGYAPVMKMNLNTEKLRSLGWKTEDSLEQMYKELIIDMRNQFKKLQDQGE